MFWVSFDFGRGQAQLKSPKVAGVGHSGVGLVLKSPWVLESVQRWEYRFELWESHKYLWGVLSWVLDLKLPSWGSKVNNLVSLLWFSI